MAAAPKTITVAPDSELAHLLDEAARRPLVLEKDGVRYRLAREEEDIWAGYDPEAVLEALEATAGSWADIDADALIADLYRAREEGSRPASRP